MVGQEESRPTAIPVSALESIVEVIKNHPDAVGFDENTLKEVALSAIEEQKLNDESWLTEKFGELKKQQEKGNRHSCLNQQFDFSRLL